MSLRDGSRLLLFAAVLACVLGAVLFGLRALANRSKDSTLISDMMGGRRGARGQLWADFGSREDFTPIGWRYRNRALVFTILAMLLVLCWWLS